MTISVSALEAYEQLSCMIDDVEGFFRDLRVPFDVSVPCDEDHRIGMIKLPTAGWRLCYLEGEDSEWRPLRDTATAFRLSAIKYLPSLKAEIENARHGLIAQIMAAVESLENMLNQWELPEKT